MFLTKALHVKMTLLIEEKQRVIVFASHLHGSASPAEESLGLRMELL